MTAQTGLMGLTEPMAMMAIKATLATKAIRAKVVMPPLLISQHWQVISGKIPMPLRVRLRLILILNKSLSDPQGLTLRTRALDDQRQLQSQRA